MKVILGVMHESSGNWWASVTIENDDCRNFFDTANKCEVYTGKGIRHAVHKAAELRKVLKTGEKLLQPGELNSLIETENFTKEQIADVYEQVSFFFHD